MRLYNAASCTPCVSTNPRTTNIDREKTPASLGGWRMESKYHKNSSTPHGNNQMVVVANPRPKHAIKVRGGNVEDLEPQERIDGRAGASKQHKQTKPPRTKQGQRRAIQPMFSDSDHLLRGQGYLYGKPVAERKTKIILNHRTNIDGEADTQSFSATLATTRSRLLQQHDDTAVNVSSRSLRKPATRNDGVVMKYPNQEAGLATGESAKWDIKEEDKDEDNENEGVDNREEFPQVSLVNSRASSSSSGNSSTMSQYWTRSARNDSEYENHDRKFPQTAQLQKEGNKTARHSEAEQINFFPLKKAPLTVVEKIATHRDRNTGVNLGVTRRFPTRVENTPNNKHLQDDETWANFGEEIELRIEDVIPTSSRASDQSPFLFADAFDLDDFKDPSFTDLIGNEHYIATIEIENWEEPEEEEKTEISGEDQVETQAIETCKTLPEENMEQPQQPNNKEKQPPKLLGPILEARFTRSYWRRHKRRSRKSKTKKNGGRYELQLDDETGKVENIAKPTGTLKPAKLKEITKTMDTSGKLERTSELLGMPGKLKNTAEPTGALLVGAASEGSHEEEEKEKDDDNEEEYEVFPEVEWFEDKPSQSDDDMGAPVTPRAPILSRNRMQECKRILGAINWSLDDLVTMIDAVDASFGVTADQIVSLQSLIPTPAEKESLLKPPLGIGQLSEEEEFMAQMMGVPELEGKLEWLLFQCQFPVIIKRFCDDLNLFERACDEILASPKLDKVLGIINLLGNRLVGRTPDKKKETKISISSLIQMLDEVEASQLLEKTNHSQPFLSYALAKIQSSNPSLLNFKQEMPLLSRAAQELEGFYAELEQFENKLEDFRRFALSLILPKSHTSKGVAYAEESDISKELHILESSTLGTVVVDFFLKISGLYQTVDVTERAFGMLCSHFNEDDDNVHDEDGKSNKPVAGIIMKALVRFCESTVRFRESTVAHL